MKSFLLSILGVVAGVFYIAFAGLLEIQAIGLKQGAIYDISNRIVSVRPPSFPFFPYFSNALLGALVFYVIFIRFRNSPLRQQIFLKASFAASTLGLIIPVGMTFWERLREADVPQIRFGFFGWLQVGSSVTAVHLLAVLALLSIFWSALHRRDKSSNPSVQAAPRGDASM